MRLIFQQETSEDFILFPVLGEVDFESQILNSSLPRKFL